MLEEIFPSFNRQLMKLQYIGDTKSYNITNKIYGICHNVKKMSYSACAKAGGM